MWWSVAGTGLELQFHDDVGPVECDDGTQKKQHGHGTFQPTREECAGTCSPSHMCMWYAVFVHLGFMDCLDQGLLNGPFER